MRRKHTRTQNKENPTVSVRASENAKSPLSDADIANGYIVPANEPVAVTKPQAAAPDLIEDAIPGYTYILEEQQQFRGFEYDRTDAERMVLLQQELIESTLQKYGFTNRIDIKSGITSTIAIFTYSGKDPRVLAMVKYGYIIVKLPPVTADQTSHAVTTYRNEVSIIQEIAHIASNSRPMLLTLNLDGIDFIFNSALFHDEANFLKKRDAILNGIDEECDSSDATSDDDSYAPVDIEYALRHLVRQSFHNLSTYMTELAVSEINPAKKFDLLFCSMLKAVNDLHKDDVLHLDIADRNFVVLKDGTAMIVDFGMADMLFRVNNRSRSNRKLSIVSLMYNVEALKKDKFCINMITDYVSLQKTMLQAIADYCGLNFYQICAQAPGASQTTASVTTELMQKLKDEDVINNAIANIRAYAASLSQYNTRIGLYALEVLEKYMPFFTHQHIPGQTFDELRNANNAKFYACSPHVHAPKPREKVAEAVNNHNDHIKKHQERPAPKPERTISKSNVAATAQMFSQQQSSNNSNNDPAPAYKK